MNKKLFTAGVLIVLLACGAVFAAENEPAEVDGVYIIPISSQIKDLLLENGFDEAQIKMLSTSALDGEVKVIMDDLNPLVLNALGRAVRKGYGPAKMRIGIYTWTLTPED
ncbi:MAG: hypothetical protein ACLFST_07705 [Spirochaetia bacterium]